MVLYGFGQCIYQGYTISDVGVSSKPSQLWAKENLGGVAWQYIKLLSLVIKKAAGEYPRPFGLADYQLKQST